MAKEAEIIKMDDFSERWRVTKKNKTKIVEIRFDEDKIVKGVSLLSELEREELTRLTELDVLAIVKVLKEGGYKLEREPVKKAIAEEIRKQVKGV